MLNLNKGLVVGCLGCAVFTGNAADIPEQNAQVEKTIQVETQGYASHPEAQDFIARMVDEHKFERTYVENLLAAAEKKQSILDAIARPAEKTKPWFEYRKIFLGEDRIQQGVEFWVANQKLLDQVEKRYGVAPEIVIAILGVETRYGKYMGSYRVLDALSTLGFDYPPRGKFFESELEHFLLLSREQKQDPLTLKGSYAGAMGYGQFIPSSYRRYAIDNDGDAFADIWNNTNDAVGSVANYFKAHGWQKDKPVFVRAELSQGFDASILYDGKRPDLSLAELEKKGYKIAENAVSDWRTLNAVPLEYQGEQQKEYWLGFNNFYVITRYNRSQMYALAVWQLSQEIKQRYSKQHNVKNKPEAENV